MIGPQARPVQVLDHGDSRRRQQVIQGLFEQRGPALERRAATARLLQLLARALQLLRRIGVAKGLRTRFFPLQELARDAASALPFGRGSLRAALAEYLSGVGATEIRPDMFDAGRLPPHLRLHVEVVDASGAVVAQGDDVAELRRRLAASAPAGSSCRRCSPPRKR